MDQFLICNGNEQISLDFDKIICAIKIELLNFPMRCSRIATSRC